MSIIRQASMADFIFSAGSYPYELKVLSFSGIEAISEPFRYNIRLFTKGTQIGFDNIVGQRVCLSIYGENGERYINGIVTRFTQTGMKDQYRFYTAEIMPALWLLSLKSRCQIFQNRSTEDIISYSIDDTSRDISRIMTINISLANHTQREYCVQYRESNLNFISRLMEDEGIFYFFKHSKDGHEMVIADSPSIHEAIESSTIVFKEMSGLVPKSEQIYEFNWTQQVSSGRVSLRDFNYETPSVNLETESGDGSFQENWDIHDYPGNYKEQTPGNEMAKLRLQSLRTQRQVGFGQSVCSRLLPGYRFTLDQHPVPELNTEYLITRFTSSGSQPFELDSGEQQPSYSNEFECIPYSVPYRPLRKTPKPVVDGIQTAIVVGPGGEQIYTDNYGRVKVQFHWDRKGNNDENSSCWVRVSNGYAGQTHGSQLTPLIGDEVIIDFLEGDPDKPLIVGSVYNADNMPSLKKEDAIQNVILTPYQHRLLFDDNKQNIILNTGGKETIKMSDAEKDKDYGNNINLSTADGYFIHLAKGNKAESITISTKKSNFIVLDEKNENVVIKTNGGHIAVMDDKNKKIEIKSTDSHKITIDDQGKNITLVGSDGQQKFQIDINGKKIIISSGNGDIELSAPTGKISLSAKNIELKATQGLSMESSAGDASLKGKNVKVEAIIDAKIKGVNVTSEAIANNTTKGFTINNQATAVNTITGMPVKIN
jgi:type VI secretion system VgrG family protein